MNKKQALAILGLIDDADWPEIQRSFREQTKRHHPDRFKEGTPEHEAAVNKQKLLNLAFEHLSTLRYANRNNETESKPASHAWLYFIASEDDLVVIDSSAILTMTSHILCLTSDNRDPLYAPIEYIQGFRTDDCHAGETIDRSSIFPYDEYQVELRVGFKRAKKAFDIRIAIIDTAFRSTFIELLKIKFKNSQNTNGGKSETHQSEHADAGRHSAKTKKTQSNKQFNTETSEKQPFTTNEP